MELLGSSPASTTSSLFSSKEDSSSISPSTLLLLAKVGSMFVLGFGSLLLGSLPLIIGRCRSKKCEHRRPIGSVSSASTTLTSSSTLSDDSQPDSSQGLLTSLLLCFGGGVLLFTTFLHLAPEVRDSINKQQKAGQLFTLGDLSLADLLFCAGFFLVYLVEETVHAALTNKPETSDALLYRTVSVRRAGAGASNHNGNYNNNNNNNHNHNNNNGEHLQHHQTASNCNSSKTSSSASSSEPRSRGVWRSESSDVDDDGLQASATHNSGPCRPGKHATLLLSPAPALAPHFNCELGQQQEQPQQGPPTPAAGAHGHAGHHHLQQQQDNSMRSLLTVLALSFHAIFEGLTVGLEPALGSVIYLAAAIATHKLVISFCVGMELYVAGASRRSILGYLSVFAMVTPLGIAIGLGLGQVPNNAGAPGGENESLGPTPTILQAMAAGTLLYVVFFEVLARERANEKSGLLQLAAIFLGFMLMLGLQLVTAHKHSHGHSDDEHSHSHDEDLNDSTQSNYLIDAAIERVTNKVVDVLSTTVT